MGTSIRSLVDGIFFRSHPRSIDPVPRLCTNGKVLRFRPTSTSANLLLITTALR